MRLQTCLPPPDRFAVDLPPQTGEVIGASPRLDRAAIYRYGIIDRLGPA